jgi:hypothetical protein
MTRPVTPDAACVEAVGRIALLLSHLPLQNDADTAQVERSMEGFAAAFAVKRS